MKQRSQQQELMDTGEYSAEEYRDCLQKLFLVGRYTGIHRDTYKILQMLQPNSILDVGCGDGALLTEIGKRLPNTLCHGIDISKEAIQHAQSSHNVSFSCSRTLERADVVMATLVCHHMTDEELREFIESAYNHANRLVLINDLQRSRLSKVLYRFVSPLFSNRLISHDGVVSIERGFKRHELRSLIPYSCSIRWRIPFRWQVLIWKK